MPLSIPDPNLPPTLQLRLTPSEQGFSLSLEGESVAIPWQGLPPLLTGLLRLSVQRGLSLVALSRALLSEEGSGLTACREQGAGWIPVGDDGQTPDPEFKPKAVLWRPGGVERPVTLRRP